LVNTLTADKLQTLTLEGDTYINIESALDDSVATIDASATTGGVNLDISNIADADDDGTSSYSVTTGSGNDNLGEVSGAVKGSIKTGDGKDTLILKDLNHDNNGTTTAFESQIAIDMGAGDDKVTVTTAEAFQEGSSLNMGDGEDTLDLVLNNNIDLTNLGFSDTEKIILEGGNSTYTLGIDSLDGQTIEITNVAGSTSKGVLAGTDVADTIDFSSSGNLKDITFIGTNNLTTINAGGGDDKITAGADALTINGGGRCRHNHFGWWGWYYKIPDTAANNGVDSISSFTAGSTNGDIFDFSAFNAATVDTQVDTAAGDSLNVNIADSLDYSSDTVNVIALADIQEVTADNFGDTASTTVIKQLHLLNTLC